MRDLYPLTFEPVLKQYLWGGRNLARLGRPLPAQGPVAESWEIAAHPDGTTRVDNGRYRGRLLTDLQAELGPDLVGTDNQWALERAKFPLLVKLIDAQQPLSVQVHPNDAYARAHEGDELGKTEMWVVLSADPGAELVLGARAGTDRDELGRAIAENRLDPLLHRVAIGAGDYVRVPAGMLHSILGGSILVEIQQNSNTTYRVYDWGRLEADGRPRPLHVGRALDVIDFSHAEPGLGVSEPIGGAPGVARELLWRNRYFTAERLHFQAGATFCGNCDGHSLEIWGVLQGSIRIQAETLSAVRFALLPAAMGPYAVTAPAASLTLRVLAGG